MSLLNPLRWRAILIAREYKQTFLAGDVPSVPGERVLADLRGFCWADRPTIFDKDTHEMARREGRREVFVRIVKMLNLDENAVQQLMEVDSD